MSNFECDNPESFAFSNTVEDSLNNRKSCQENSEIMSSDPMQFSRHALEKMRSRGVTKQQVTEAIKSPDSTYEDIESKLSVAAKQVEKMNLVVIYALSSNSNRIVTVYHASDVDRLIKRKVRRRAWVPKH